MTIKVDGTNGVLQAYDYQVLTTGFSYTFAAGTQTLFMNPAGTLATGTITMPAAPADGMVITFSSTQTISTLTVNGNTGQSITGTPGVLPANTAMSFVYRLSNTTWYPMQMSPNGTLCRAWVNFNGTTSPGTIRASFNVTSVTKNGTGDYTVNFTNALPDANYVFLVTSEYGASNNFVVTAPTTTAARLTTYTTTTGANADKAWIGVGIFR